MCVVVEAHCRFSSPKTRLFPVTIVGSTLSPLPTPDTPFLFLVDHTRAGRAFSICINKWFGTLGCQIFPGIDYTYIATVQTISVRIALPVCRDIQTLVINVIAMAVDVTTATGNRSGCQIETLMLFDCLLDLYLWEKNNSPGILSRSFLKLK